MSEYDFERLSEYSLIDKRFEYATRKRVPYYERFTDSPSDDGGGYSNEVQFPGPGDSNYDPDFAQLMKEYENDADKLDVCDSSYNTSYPTYCHFLLVLHYVALRVARVSFHISVFSLLFY